MPWRLKGRLETTSSYSDFYSGVDVWIRRPNVLNRKLIGAVIQLESETGSRNWSLDDLDSIASLRVGDLLDGKSSVTEKEVEEMQDVDKTPSGSGKSKLLVRQLLPRLKQIHSTHELIIIGTHSTYYTTSESY